MPPASGFDQDERKRKVLLATLRKADLGECGALLPRHISATAAQLEAFGTDLQVFDRFDRWFREATGVEPDVSFRQLAPAQCPPIAFLSRSLGDGTGGPSISVNKAVLGRDDLLTGLIVALHPVVELLIVDDEGRSYNVTARMRPGDNERGFAMRVQAGGGGTKALLVLAVGSEKPFSAFRKSDRGPAAEVFADATAELAAHPEARSALAYVQVE
jgi:serine/threonine-protein kinase